MTKSDDKVKKVLYICSGCSAFCAGSISVDSALLRYSHIPISERLGDKKGVKNRIEDFTIMIRKIKTEE